MACDLHLALHEGDLRVELAQADLLEIVVCHRESGISFGGLSLLAHSLTIFEINFVDERRLGALLFRNLEAKDRIDFGNKSLTMASSQVGRHHAEDFLGLEI